MGTRSDQAAQAAIGAAARELRLPTIRAEATRLAEIATRELRHEGRLTSSGHIELRQMVQSIPAKPT